MRRDALSFCDNVSFPAVRMAGRGFSAAARRSFPEHSAAAREVVLPDRLCQARRPSAACAALILCCHVKHRSEWEHAWREFMNRRGTPVGAQMPVVAGANFDAFAMFHQVHRHGGFRHVVNNKKMHNVVKAVGLVKGALGGRPAPRVTFSGRQRARTVGCWCVVSAHRR